MIMDAIDLKSKYQNTCELKLTDGAYDYYVLANNVAADPEASTIRFTGTRDAENLIGISMSCTGETDHLKTFLTKKNHGSVWSISDRELKQQVAKHIINCNIAVLLRGETEYGSGTFAGEKPVVDISKKRVFGFVLPDFGEHNITFKILDDKTSKTIGGVKLNIFHKDGKYKECLSDDAGKIIYPDIKKGVYDLKTRVSDIWEINLKNTFNFTGSGIAVIAHETDDNLESPDKSFINPYSKKDRKSYTHLINIIEHKVEDGETFTSIAEKYQLSFRELGYFNWQIYRKEDVLKSIKYDVGYRALTDDQKDCFFDHQIDPGIIYIPQSLEEVDFQCNKTHTLRLNQCRYENRLYSTFAIDQFRGLAAKMGQDDFYIWSANIFGFDIPVDHYKRLRNDLLNNQLNNPVIRLVKQSFNGGYEAGFDNDQEEIRLRKYFPEKAQNANWDAWKLLIILVEEFGHYIDYILRYEYEDENGKKIEGDANLDEGARYAYALLNFDFDKTEKVHFADYIPPDEKKSLYAEYQDLNLAVELWLSHKRQDDDDKDVDFEYWGPGLGKGTCSHGHESLEQVLLDVGFERRYLKYIYFGNWMRDFSQVIDPKTVRPPGKESIFDGLTKQTWTKIIDYLSLFEFGEDKDKNGERIFKVTEERLGLYRSEEHLDNPFGIEDSDADKGFRGACTKEELEVDPSTWIKKYLINKGPWPNSADYVKNQLELAADMSKSKYDRYRHFGAALHSLEDLYAHTNFVELALIKFGHTKVVPWSKKMGNGFYPLVTGSFGGLDSAASLLIPVAEHLENEVECKAGVRSPGMRMALIILQDTNLKWKNGLEGVLNDFEAIEQKYPDAATLLCRTISQSLQFISIYMGHTIHFMANCIDDVQTLTGLGPNPENPTHSQLSKDHDDHPFHMLGAECTMDLIKTLGAAMQQTWDGEMDPKELQELAVSYFIHPEKINLNTGETTTAESPEHLKRLMRIVRDWSKKPENMPLIEKASSASWVEDQCKKVKNHYKYFENLSKKYTGNKEDLLAFINFKFAEKKKETNDFMATLLDTNQHKKTVSDKMKSISETIKKRGESLPNDFDDFIEGITEKGNKIAVGSQNFYNYNKEKIIIVKENLEKAVKGALNEETRQKELETIKVQLEKHNVKEFLMKEKKHLETVTQTAVKKSKEIFDKSKELLKEYDIEKTGKELLDKSKNIIEDINTDEIQKEIEKTIENINRSAHEKANELIDAINNIDINKIQKNLEKQTVEKIRAISKQNHDQINKTIETLKKETAETIENCRNQLNEAIKLLNVK